MRFNFSQIHHFPLKTSIWIKSRIFLMHCAINQSFYVSIKTVRKGGITISWGCGWGDGCDPHRTIPPRYTLKRVFFKPPPTPFCRANFSNNSFPNNLFNFLSNAYNLPRLGFQIYDIQITGKYICHANVCYTLKYLVYSPLPPRQHSPLGTHRFFENLSGF